MSVRRTLQRVNVEIQKVLNKNNSSLETKKEFQRKTQVKFPLFVRISEPQQPEKYSKNFNVSLCAYSSLHWNPTMKNLFKFIRQHE
jgi:hypothetical protein